jgi:hypothetical protein
MSTPNEKALVARQSEEPSVALMLQTFIEKGITAESVGAFSQLCELKERMDAKQAEREFAADFLALKKALPAVRAMKPVMNKDGQSVRYTFAPLEEIDAALSGPAMAHGFTYSFSEGEAQAGKVTKVCTVTHKGGHSKSNSFTVRIGSGPPGSSESQSDGAAHSYAKRGALCDAFGIIVEKDTDGDDARTLGAYITQEQADELREMCDDVNANRVKFLAFAQADSFEHIHAAKLESLKSELMRKAAQK